MPQVVPVVLGAVGYLVGTAAGGTVLGVSAATFGALVGSVVGSVVSYAISATTRKSSDRESRVSASGHLVNTKDTQQPLPVIYGQMQVGGSFVYMHATGANNNLLHLVMTLGEGEIESLVKLYLDNKLSTDYGNFVYYEFFSGSANQAYCATLNAADPNWVDPLRNTAYLYIRLTYNQNKFPSLPNITAVVKGRKVYDPRTGNTAWSDNPALCLYDFFTNERYGVGIPASFWDEDSVKDVANWCDDKGYKFNGVIWEREPAIDVVQRMLASFRGTIIWSEGTFRMVALDYDSPVMSLTEDEIKADSFQVDVPGVGEFPNVLRVKFPDEDANYVLSDFVLTDEDAISVDGEQRENQLDIIGVTDYEQAYKMAVYQLERQRLNKLYSFIAGPKALVLEPGDMITVTHSLPGWNNKQVRVQDVRILNNHEAQITVLEETADLYDDTLNVAAHTQSTTNLPDPTAIPPQVENVSFSEDLYTMKDRTYVRLKVSWDDPIDYPYLDHVEVWISEDGTNYTFHVKATGSATLEPTNEGEVWYFKLVPVSIWGVKRELADVTAYLHTVVGKTDLPSTVQNFHALVAGDTVHLAWDEVPEKDIVGYELRYGDSWAESIFVVLVNATAKTLVGMKPGTHTLFICAKDALGEYSLNATWVTVDVFLPPSYSEKHSWDDDFTEGTHNNTERYNDPTYGWVLRAIHNGNLTGYWESPVKDMSAVKKVRLWTDYELAALLKSDTWEGFFDNDEAKTWEDVLTEGEGWLAAFEVEMAGNMYMMLYWSEDNVNWKSAQHLEILSMEVEARYVKYEIHIEDNDPDSRIMVKAPCTLDAYYWQ